MTDAPDQFDALLSRLREDPALGNLLGPAAPVLVWNEDAGKLLWSSPSAADLGASLVDQAASLHPGSRAMQRLRALAGGQAPSQGVRLERLLLDPSRLSPPMTCACRLATLENGAKVLVTVIVGTPPRVRKAQVLPGLVPPVVNAPPRAHSSGNLRFVWQTDAQTRFIHVSDGLAEAVGPMAADILGRGWAEISQSVAQDASGEITELFARQETWSGRTIQWRVDNKRGTVPVDLAGMPILGAERELVGFRGFGLIRKDALDDLADDEQPREGHRPAISENGDAGATGAVAEPAGDGAPPAKGSLSPNSADLSDEAQNDAEELLIEFEPVASRLKAPGLEVVRSRMEESDPEAGSETTHHEPQSQLERDLTDDEKLFEQLRETVAASLSEPTIELYGSPEAEDPEESEPAPLIPSTPRNAEPQTGLSNTERHAFREIARALGARLEANSTDDRPSRDTDKVLPFRGRSVVPDTTADQQGEADDTEVSEQPGLIADGLLSDDAGVETVAESASSAESQITAPTQDESSPVPPEPEIVPAANEPNAAVFEGGEHAAIDGRTLLARLSIPALVHRDEHVVFANPALLTLTGYDDREHLAAAGGLPRLLGSNLLSSNGATLTTRQHEEMPVELQRSTVPWDGVDAELIVIRRLPERDGLQRLAAVEADLSLRDSRIHELESVLDTATDGVIVLDETGRILSLNRSAEALFGYNQSDVVGDAITVLLAPESHIVALDYLDGLRSPGVASLLNDGREVFGRVRQGGAIPLFMTIGRVSDAPDRKLCAVLRDITAFKKAEGELVGARRAAEQANAQKSDLLAKISHEIRTPLNAILGFAEVMLEERFGPVGNDRYKEYLKDVHASGAHVISLVNDLLDLAKVEAGRMDLSFTSVSLNDLVSSCFTLLQPQAARDRIVMRTSFAAKLPSVVADDRSVRQIVLNLVSNAIKFTDAGGQVIVSTALTDRGEVAFRVRDTGIGMNDQEVEAALEPFRQLATSRKRGGTGLGLPLTKALVEANRGALQISSQPNEGTLVEVIFPPTRVLAE